MVRKMKNVNEVITQIDGLEDTLIQCRSFFPTLSKTLIGQKSFPTAPYYQAKGYTVFIKTKEPITQGFIDRYSQIGKLINEAGINRLYGIMEYYKFTKKINRKIPGWREVDLMRRLRNVFTKTKLNYQPNDPRNIRLRQELIKHFDVREDELPNGEIPTPINQVIMHIFEGCRKYVSGVISDT